MKKLLLSGAALAAFAMTATPAAAELELGLGGKFSAYGVFADQDDNAGEPGADTADFDLIRDTEIYFLGETTLDNGLTVGVEVQLEGSSKDSASSTDDQIDEAYLYLAGNWGRVNLGSENGAGYLLQVGAPAVDPLFDGVEPQFVIFNSGGNNAALNGDYGISIGGDGDRGDTEKFTYLTPVFSGFQAGISYSPDVCEDDNTCSFPRGGFPSNNTAGVLEQEIQFGARWAGDFEGVGVTVGGGYASADLEAAGGGLDDDRDVFSGGIQLATAGFTVGGAYYDDNNGVSSDGDTQTFTLGAAYETGPYRVAVSYLDSETEETGGGEDELTRILFGGSYTYGPGMTFNGAVHYYELNDDAGAAADENDVTAFTLGTTVNF